MNGSGSGSRRRAVAFAVLASICAIVSVTAARPDAGASEGLGELRDVVVVEREIEGGTRITSRLASDALAVREMPARFLPPDAFPDPAPALGARAGARIPAGSYLLLSQLRRGKRTGPAEATVGRGLRSVEVVVSGGPGGAGGLPAPGSRVDVLAADEPGSTSNPRVHVLARDVPLVALEPLRGDGLEAPSGGPPASWLATLALDRRRSLAVIEADNYAREVRLLAR